MKEELDKILSEQIVVRQILERIVRLEERQIAYQESLKTCMEEIKNLSRSAPDIRSWVIFRGFLISSISAASAAVVTYLIGKGK